MSRRITLATAVMYAAMVLLPVLSHTDPLRPHKTNFFLLEREGEVFLPLGANADFLLSPDVSPGEAESILRDWKSFGINTLRINLGGAADHWSNKAPETGPLERADAIVRFAEENGMAVIPVLFDIAGMAASWETHPANRANGGGCAGPLDYFTNASERMRGVERLREWTGRFGGRDCVIWELARGLNLDDTVKGADRAQSEGIVYWTVYMLDELLKAGGENPAWVSFMPNTMPPHLMAIRGIGGYLLHIESGDPVSAAVGGAQMIQAARSYKKPVFVGEMTWTGPDNRRAIFTKNLLWSSFAAGASAFLTPPGVEPDRPPLASDLAAMREVSFARALAKLGGPPRPPSEAPIQASPADSFHLIDSLVGNDWLFWVLRKEPGKGRAALEFRVVEGWYDLAWFDSWTGQAVPPIQRRIHRRRFVVETPEFEQSVFGRLRFAKPLEKMEIPERGTGGGDSAEEGGGDAGR